MVNKYNSFQNLFNKASNIILKPIINIIGAKQTVKTAPASVISPKPKKPIITNRTVPEFKNMPIIKSINPINNIIAFLLTEPVDLRATLI